MPAPGSRLRSRPVLRRLYRTIAPLYDIGAPLVSSRARETGRAWLNVQDGESVLDVGTGTGLVLAPLAAANPTGWTEGIDASPRMLDAARRRLAEIPHRRYGLRWGDATDLPYPANAFDALFSSYAIDVLPASHIRPALRELHRVLRPDGRLVLVYLSPPRTLLERGWAALSRACPPLLGGDRPLNLREPLQDVGFTRQAATTCTQLALRSTVVRATPAY